MTVSDLAFLTSTIGLWVIAIVGASVILAILRMVGELQQEVAAQHQSHLKTMQVGGELPDFTAVDISSGAAVTRAAVMGRRQTLTFLTPGCSTCDSVVSWARSGVEPTIWLLATDVRTARKSQEQWDLPGLVLSEQSESFRRVFKLPSIPFAIAIDEISTIVAARMLTEPSDLDFDVARRNFAEHSRANPVQPGRMT
jgi:hypothetical protein